MHCRPITAFLEAQTGCPFPLLSQVPASLLARTLEELQHVPDQVCQCHLQHFCPYLLNLCDQSGHKVACWKGTPYGQAILQALFQSAALDRKDHKGRDSCSLLQGKPLILIL